MSILQQVRKFQSDMDGIEIIKATEAYGYYYATLKDILDVISPVLKKNKIWYSHHTGYEATIKCNTLTTIVYNVDNEEDFISCHTIIDGDAQIAKMNKFMVEGSAITYFRRYHITTLLGLTTDEDTDAAGKRVVKKESQNGRSIEAATNVSSKPDFVKIFTGLLEKKTKAQIEKTFDAYKPQMDNDEIKLVSQLIIEKYGN